MKKSHKIIITILISVLVIIILLAASGIGTFFSFMRTSNNDKKQILDISEVLDIKISDEKMIDHIETHGGFHGDGTTFVSMEITDEATVEEIKSEWNELPLTDNLTALVYGVKEDTSSIGPYITEDGETLFPQIENGYYYFNDRQNEGKDSSDDADVLNRPSFNFIIAIFDTDTNRLYYCKFDT